MYQRDTACNKDAMSEYCLSELYCHITCITYVYHPTYHLQSTPQSNGVGEVRTVVIEKLPEEGLGISITVLQNSFNLISYTFLIHIKYFYFTL